MHEVNRNADIILQIKMGFEKMKMLINMLNLKK